MRQDPWGNGASPSGDFLESVNALEKKTKILDDKTAAVYNQLGLDKDKEEDTSKPANSPGLKDSE